MLNILDDLKHFFYESISSIVIPLQCLQCQLSHFILWKEANEWCGFWWRNSIGPGKRRIPFRILFETLIREFCWLLLVLLSLLFYLTNESRHQNFVCAIQQCGNGSLLRLRDNVHNHVWGWVDRTRPFIQFEIHLIERDNIKIDFIYAYLLFGLVENRWHVSHRRLYRADLICKSFVSLLRGRLKRNYHKFGSWHLSAHLVTRSNFEHPNRSGLFRKVLSISVIMIKSWTSKMFLRLSCIFKLEIQLFTSLVERAGVAKCSFPISFQPELRDEIVRANSMHNRWKCKILIPISCDINLCCYEILNRMKVFLPQKKALAGNLISAGWSDDKFKYLSMHLPGLKWVQVENGIELLWRFVNARLKHLLLSHFRQ